MSDNLTTLKPTTIPQVSRYAALIETPGKPPADYIRTPELELVVQSFLMLHRMPSRRLQTPRTLLVQGAPGVGKTLVMRQAARMMGTAVLMTPPSIFASKFEDGAIQELEDMLHEAQRFSATTEQHIVVFFDDMDHSTLSVGENTGHTVTTATIIGYLQNLSHKPNLFVDVAGNAIPFLASSNAANRIAPSLFRDMRAKRHTHVVSDETKLELAHRQFQPVGTEERRTIDKLFKRYAREDMAFWPALKSAYDQHQLEAFIRRRGFDIAAAEKALSTRPKLDARLLAELAARARESRPANFLWTRRKTS